MNAVCPGVLRSEPVSGDRNGKEVAFDRRRAWHLLSNAMLSARLRFIWSWVRWKICSNFFFSNLLHLLVGGWHWVCCCSCSYILSSGWQWQSLLQEQRAGQHTAEFYFLRLSRSGLSRSVVEISIWGVINKTAELRSVLWRWQRHNKESRLLL